MLTKNRMGRKRTLRYHEGRDLKWQLLLQGEGTSEETGTITV